MTEIKNIEPCLEEIEQYEYGFLLATSLTQSVGFILPNKASKEAEFKSLINILGTLSNAHTKVLERISILLAETDEDKTKEVLDFISKLDRGINTQIPNIEFDGLRRN